MKKLFLIISLLATTLFAELDWEDYEDAVDMAKESDKIVMVMLSREGCPACEYMKDIVFENDDIDAMIKKNFIPVHVDIHSDFVPDNLTYVGTPTFHFLNKKEKKLDRIDGGKNAKVFMEFLEKVRSKK